MFKKPILQHNVMFKLDKQKAKETIQIVFAKPSYTLLATAITLFVFVFNVTLPNINLVFIKFAEYGITDGLSLVWSMVTGVTSFMSTSSIISLALLAVLTGMSISLAIFKMKNLQSFNLQQGGAVGIGGFLMGVLVPGCSSCGIGVLASLGLASGLAVLPFRGLEISILSIIVMVILVAWLATGARDAPACKIKSK